MAQEQLANSRIKDELILFEDLIKELKKHITETVNGKYPWCNLGSIVASNNNIMEALTLFDTTYERKLDKRQGRD